MVELHVCAEAFLFWANCCSAWPVWLLEFDGGGRSNTLLKKYPQSSFFTSSTLPPLSCSCVSTQRKPEEEQSPVKETDAKQAKQEATLNGSGDSTARNGNGVQEGESQEASDRVYSTWSCPEGVTFVSFLWSALGRSWNESRGPLIKHDSLLTVVVWFFTLHLGWWCSISCYCGWPYVNCKVSKVNLAKNEFFRFHSVASTSGNLRSKDAVAEPTPSNCVISFYVSDQNPLVSSCSLPTSRPLSSLQRDGPHVFDLWKPAHDSIPAPTSAVFFFSSLSCK